MSKHEFTMWNRDWKIISEPIVDNEGISYVIECGDEEFCFNEINLKSCEELIE